MKKLLLFFITGVMIIMTCGCGINAEPSGNEKLIDAVNSGNLEAAKEAIGSGADVNSLKPYTDTTPFSEKDSNPAAISYSLGEYEIAKQLISNGSDPNYYGDGNETYLMLETQDFYNYDFMDFLLSNGADINFKTPDGNTVFKYLLTSNVTECIDNNYLGFTQMFSHLIDKGADYKEVLDGFDISELSNYNIISFVYDFMKKHSIDANLDDTLLYALNCDEALYLKSIENGSYTSCDKTKLAFFTVAYGSINLVKALCEKEDIAEITDADGNTLAFAAAVNQDPKVAEYIIKDLSVPLNRNNSNGINELTYSLALGNTEYAERLFSAGSKIQMDEWLLKGGEDDDATTADALIASVLNDQKKSVEFLIKNGYSFDNISLTFDALMSIIDSDNVDMLEYFIEQGVAKPDMKWEENEENLLSYACRQNAEKCVKYLLKNGAAADYELTGNPLCFVVEDHNSELAGLLIENNINIDEEDQDGYTPLMKAVDVGDIELIGLLIDNGADINHVNASRNSAVSMAKDSLSEKIKSTLLHYKLDRAIVNYEYDEWGRILSITNRQGTPITSDTNIGLLNPFRYRCYVYDDETGMTYVDLSGITLETGDINSAEMLRGS